ncbi:unnamed protein product [Rhodiola kirilowii]
MGSEPIAHRAGALGESSVDNAQVKGNLDFGSDLNPRLDSNLLVGLGQ